MLPTWMYSKSADGLYVNLFAGSRVRVGDVAGTSVEIEQETDYPWSGRVAITVNPAARRAFTLHLRVPNRDVSALYKSTPGVRGFTALSVNGRRVTPAQVHGYAVIRRTWAPGDRVVFDIPMAPQRVHASEKIEALRGKVALRYGPLVYNIERVDQEITRPLAPAAPLATEFRANLLGGVRVITSAFADGSPLVAVPNVVRMNRQPPAARAPAPTPGQPRPVPPTSSIVWINEA
jgi:DUF1680 family protein